MVRALGMHLPPGQTLLLEVLRQSVGMPTLPEHWHILTLLVLQAITVSAPAVMAMSLRPHVTICLLVLHSVLVTLRFAAIYCGPILPHARWLAMLPLRCVIVAFSILSAMSILVRAFENSVEMNLLGIAIGSDTFFFIHDIVAILVLRIGVATAVEQRVKPPAPPVSLVKSTDDAAWQIHADGQCSICLGELRIEPDSPAAGLPCKHIFHEVCIRRWLETGHQCPFRCSSLPARAAGRQQRPGRGAASGGDDLEDPRRQRGLPDFDGEVMSATL